MRLFHRLLWLAPALLLVAALFFSVTVFTKAHAASTITVSTCDATSLDSALSTAQASSGNTINFACSGDIVLDQTLNITTILTIDGSGQTVTLDGNQKLRVLHVGSGANLTLNNLTIANGNAGSANGGGISNSGTMSISNSTLNGNTAGGLGGSISNSGTMSISNSTLNGNTARVGGGIANGGTMSISNSTLNGNTAGGLGGGIFNDANATVKSQGSIIAGNTSSSGNDCFNNGGTITDQGYNLERGWSCGFTDPSSLQNTDPKLASALANNGGPTQTLALLDGSPAIDQVPLSACPSTDQRGDKRPDTGAETTCDIGAYEFVDPVDSDLGLANLPANMTVNASSPNGATVTYTSPTVVDEESPLPTVSCIPASGSTFAVGTTAVTCTATDSDDTNSPVSQSFTVTVLGASAQVSNLITLVNSFGLAQGMQNSLDSQLQTVLADLQANNPAQANSDLQGFINHVKAQAGKKLTQQQAQQLLNAASQIRATLGY